MRIGITQRVIEHGTYPERRDALAQDWAAWCEAALPGAQLVPISNRLRDPSAWADALELQGLILSGGDDIGTTPDRDATELQLLRHFEATGRPVLGVCRGFQLINGHHGGHVTPIPGHIATMHKVDLLGELSAWTGTAQIEVNSFHSNAILGSDLASGLVPLAIAEDGSVESARHADAPVLGLQWHPERPHSDDAASALIVGAFFGTTQGDP